MENIKYIEKRQAKKDRDFLLKTLKKHFVLCKMRDSEILQICKQMKYCQCSRRKFLMK